MAFCFYNLSSIFNGLVYFDQFSLLPTSHLLLVVLGMAILLAGVWIVSFPPGGSHKIDLSRWSDDEEESDLEDVEVQIRYEDEPLPIIIETGRGSLLLLLCGGVAAVADASLLALLEDDDDAS